MWNSHELFPNQFKRRPAFSHPSDKIASNGEVALPFDAQVFF